MTRIYLIDEPNLSNGSHFLTVLRSTTHAFLHIESIELFVVTNRPLDQDFFFSLSNCDLCKNLELDNQLILEILSFDQFKMTALFRKPMLLFFLSSLSAFKQLDTSSLLQSAKKTIFVLGTSPIFRRTEQALITDTELSHREFALNELRGIQELVEKLVNPSEIEIWDWDSIYKTKIDEFPNLNFGYFPEFHEFNIDEKKKRMINSKISIGLIGSINKDRGFYEFINLAKIYLNYKFIIHGNFSDEIICRGKRFNLSILYRTRHIKIVNKLFRNYLNFLLKIKFNIPNVAMKNEFIQSESDLQSVISNLDYLYLASNRIMHPSGIQKYAIGSGTPQILVESPSEMVALAVRCKSGVIIDSHELNVSYKIKKLSDLKRFTFQPVRLVEISDVSNAVKEWMDK
jgi:hypothetical protein